jgi:hypothetical protein
LHLAARQLATDRGGLLAKLFVFNNLWINKVKGPSAKQAREPAKIGKAGEHLVAAELLIRGISVCWPNVDEGFDLLTSKGCRIQVKTARVRNIPAWSLEPVYSFHFKQRKFNAFSSGRITERPRKTFVENCDVVVLVGLEARRFWVVPPTSIDGVHCAYMGPTTVRGFEKDIPDMLEMVRLGFTQKEIGQYYGINQASVFERLAKAGVPKAEKKYIGTLRSYENRWDLILNFGQPATTEPQVPVAESAPAQIQED